MQTERVTLLVTREFKAQLHREARRNGVSVSQLIRSRCDEKPAPDEAVLAALTAEVAKSIAEARSTLQRGIRKADEVLAELQAKRSRTDRKLAVRQS